MASTSDIRAGRAFVELFADDSRLVRGLRQAERKLKAFGGSVRNLGLKMSALGSAMTAPLLASARVFGNYGDSVAKMARRTGLSVEALSELQFAAGQSGVEVSELEVGLRRMQRVIYDADRGLGSANETLRDLGLTANDLVGLAPEQQFKLLADRISQVEDPTRKAALAMGVFGRSGTNLLPLLEGGAAGIEQLQEQARRLGLTMSGNNAKAAEDFSDALDRLSKVARMAVFNVGAALAPSLQRVADIVTSLAVQVSSWISRNRELIVTALKVAAAVVAIGATIATVGIVISGFGAAIGVAASIIATTIAAVKSLGVAIAFLATPIGATIAAVSALGVYIVYATGIGSKVLQWLGEKFAALKSDAADSFQGIADALAAGDIALAAKILWLSLKLAWDNGVAMLQRVWLAFSGFFVKIGYGAFYGVLAAAEFVWHAMKVVWIEGVAFLRKLWAKFVSWHAKAVEGTADAMVSAWIWAREKTGAIDADQAAFERDYARKQREMNLRKIDQELNQSLADAEQKRQTQRDAETQRHQQRLAKIGQGYNDAAASVEAARAEKQRKTEEALAEARKQWEEAIEAARRARESKTPGGPNDNINRARDALAGLGDIGDMLQLQAAKIGARGTFVAANVLGLQAGGATDRMVNGIERIERNTRPLRDVGALAFE